MNFKLFNGNELLNTVPRHMQPCTQPCKHNNNELQEPRRILFVWPSKCACVQRVGK